MIDLADTQVRAALADRIAASYDEASIEIYREGHRNHLGASVIGEPCSRLLWYGFRWFHNHNPGGRMYRLWQRGHREEPFAFEHLRRKGHTIHTLNPETGKQWRMGALHDHFGGSCDGRGFLPPEYGYTAEVGYECKTDNDRRFKELKTHGVKKVRPKHFAQMSVYGRAWGIRYFVYISVNKNDDDKYIEIVAVDWQLADSLLLKAERIITSPTPPPKIAEHPSHSECKYCDLRSHCHFNAMPERNCRSCRLATPHFEGRWYCNRHNGIIPNEVVVTGCGDWAAIG